MPYEDPLRIEERNIEERLRKVVPAGHRLQRDSLMFQAGQRAGRRQSRPWQGLAIALLFGVVLLGWDSLTTTRGREGLLLSQTEEPARIAAPIPSRPVTPPMPVAPPDLTWPPLPAPVIEHLRLRYQLVMEGADALPVPSAYAAPGAPNETWSDWYRETAPGRTTPRLFPNLKPRQYGNPS
jgi:hypothetical protein